MWDYRGNDRLFVAGLHRRRVGVWPSSNQCGITEEKISVLLSRTIIGSLRNWIFEFFVPLTDHRREAFVSLAVEFFYEVLLRENDNLVLKFTHLAAVELDAFCWATLTLVVLSG